MHRIILPREKELIVTSFGGVGTSFVLRFLSNYRNTNNPADKDGFKHLPIPPISFNRNIKFVYIFGNPKAAAISLFKRNYHYYQSKKLQRYKGNSISPIPQDMTLEEYAALLEDKFLFRDHFFNWYSDTYRVHPTIFIRYETIFENVRPLCSFLELPDDAVDNFPKKRERSSSEIELPFETSMLLDKIYGNFSAELGKVRDVEIFESTTKYFFYSNYLRRPYQKALFVQFSTDFKQRLKKNPVLSGIIKSLKGSGTSS